MIISSVHGFLRNDVIRSVSLSSQNTSHCPNTSTPLAGSATACNQLAMIKKLNSNKSIQYIFQIKQIPNMLVIRLDRLQILRDQFPKPDQQHGCQRHVPSHHGYHIERRLLRQNARQYCMNVVQQQDRRRTLCNLGHPHPRGERAYIVRPIPLHVRQILRHGDDGGERRHEPRDEGYLGTPSEGGADGVLDGVVHPEVEEEAADGGDGQTGGEGVPFGADGGDGVDGAEGPAKHVELEEEEGEEVVHDRRSDNAAQSHRNPRRLPAHLPASHGQEGLVQLIDIGIEYLINPHDERIPQQQRDHPDHRAGEHVPPIGIRQCAGGVDQCAGGPGDGGEDRSADGVRTGEFVEGAEAGLEGALGAGLDGVDGILDGVWIEVSLHRHR
mmetsp:Transcript_30654/g.74031  ORF Transcript_30654/g.74031 Transcript_30654/m.74031 type:complete len:384 (-) Transcript_30654:136-1287(-)